MFIYLKLQISSWLFIQSQCISKKYWTKIKPWLSSAIYKTDVVHSQSHTGPLPSNCRPPTIALFLSTQWSIYTLCVQIVLTRLSYCDTNVLYLYIFSNNIPFKCALWIVFELYWDIVAVIKTISPEIASVGCNGPQEHLGLTLERRLCPTLSRWPAWYGLQGFLLFTVLLFA